MKDRLSLYIIALVVFIFPLPRLLLRKIPHVVTYFPTLEIFILCLCAALIFGKLLLDYFRQEKIGFTKFYYVIVVWLGIRILSSIFSLNFHYSLWGAYGIGSDGLVYSFLVSFFLICVVDKVKYERQVIFLLNTMVFQAALFGALSLYEAISAGVWEKTVRITSPLLNADYYISYSLLILPIIAVLLIKNLKEHNSRLISMGYAVTLCVCFITIIFALPDNMQQWILPNRTDRQVSVDEFLNNPSNNERFTEWRIAWKSGLENPILGTGPGTTKLAFFKALPTLTDWNYKYHMDHPHNDLIEQFSQTGILGAAAYLGLWIYVLYKSMRKYSHLESSIKYLVSGLISGLLLFFLFNQFLFTTIYTGIIMWVWMGLILVLIGDISEINPGRYLKTNQVLMVFAFSLICISSYFAYRHVNAEKYMEKALVSYNSRNYKKAAQLSSQAVEAYPWEANYHKQASSYATANALNNSLVDANYLTNIFEQADIAVEMNPYDPLNKLNQGMVRFLLSNSGSGLEKRSVSMIKASLKESPWDIYLKGLAINTINSKQGYMNAKADVMEISSSVPANKKDELLKLTIQK